MNQEKLNKEMTDRGKASYMKDFQTKSDNGRFSDTKEGTRLMSATADKVVIAIDEFKKDQSKRRASNQAHVYMLIKDIPSKVLAFIGLRTSLDHATTRDTVNGVFKDIGSNVLSELRFSQYKKLYPEDWKMALRYSKNAGTQHKTTFLTLCLNKREELIKWDQPKKLAVGALLFDLVNKSLGFFEVVNVKSRKKTKKIMLLRPELLNWVMEMCAYNSSLNTEYMPLVIKPYEWTNDILGGYDDSIPHYNLVSNKSQKKSNETLSTLTPDVLNSINLAQNTAWKINKDILEKLNYCINNNIEVGKKMGSSLLIKDPEIPEDIETNKEARLKYRAERSDVLKANIKNTSKRYSLLRTLNIAQKFKNTEKIYFPYCLDFRGRIYPKSLFLTPQGSDAVKALLLFAEGEKIETEDQVKWLAIHGANCFGIDKVSYDERIEWVNKNLDNIIGATEGTDFWMEASDPWLFLAFCYEWCNFKKEGLGFVTHLPVSIDGSNNGLQILSLMSRDKAGATATNVCNVDTPHDIYQDIADTVNERILDDIDDLEPAIQKIVNVINITRATVKKQTMTLAYSATFFSCRDYTGLWLTDELEDLKIKLTPNEKAKLVQYLAKLVWESINARLTKAKELMIWFVECGRVLLEAGKAIEWTTPLGFHIHQKYMNSSASTVDLNIGKRLRIQSYTELDTPAKGKHLSSISPNIVHSLDAAALQLTIVYASKCKVNNLMCVHDSFGTLCTKMDELAGCVRSAYYTLFSEDIPLKLKEHWETSNGVTLPDLPQYGDMDISELLDSDYFFC